MAGRLLNEKNIVSIDKDTRIKTWKKYIITLCQDERTDGSAFNAYTAARIIADEVRRSAEQMKEEKLSDPDNLHVELLNETKWNGWQKCLIMYTTPDIFLETG